MNRIKRHLLSALKAPGLRAAFRPLRAGVGSILMMHRLTDPDSGAVGHDPAELRLTLAMLRRLGYELVDLGEMFRRLREAGPRDDLGVAFTLDDGYAEQVRVAGPIFAEFDCPATVYLATGFLDQALWMWWDRIEYVFESTTKRQITTTIHGATLKYELSQVGRSVAAIRDFVARCKLIPDEARNPAIHQLAAAAEIDLPTTPPPRYAPMTWAEVQSWETRGLSFGPHTVTHPILSRTSDEASRHEVIGSWNRLREMVRRPTPIFCYPNGLRGDFGPREVATAQSAGLEGAIVSTPGYAQIGEFRANPESPFLVKRLHYPDDSRVLNQYVCGVGRIRPG